jgi:membrane protein implicated in regulation of membrane protease activity
MQHNGADWWNKSRMGRSLLFAFFFLVVLVFAGACFAVFCAITPWPIWLLIVISLPMGLLVFLAWAKTNEKNGFDGVVVDHQSEKVQRVNDRSSGTE